MKLYYRIGTCSLSPHIVLREAGLPFQLKKVDTQRQVDDGSNYEDINPKGSVPALMLDDGQVLTEGAAIVQYIADLKPESGLAPKNGTIERYRLMEMLNFIATELHKNFSPVFHKDMGEDARQVAVKNLTRRFTWIDQILTEKPFLLGPQFSVADAYLFVMLKWAHGTKLDLSALHTLPLYFEKIKSRPAVQAALAFETAAK